MLFPEFRIEFDPFQRLNSVNIFLGHAVSVLSICGCQQTAVQRYCSMSSLTKGVMYVGITYSNIAVNSTELFA
jgi:hypothetical protein